MTLTDIASQDRQGALTKMFGGAPGGGSALASIMGPENREKRAMALFGLGEILKGNSVAPVMNHMMQSNLLKQEAAREKAERTEALKLTTDVFRDIQGNTASYTPPDPNSPAGIGADTMKALGKESFTPGDRDSFITAMLPYAREAGETTGLDPRLIVAQSALETGYGRSAPGNNFFGIKSHGLPGGNVLATTEFNNGTRLSTRDSFRQYGGMGDSVAGYVDFLQSNPRYSNMLAAEGLDAQLEALGNSGYATDPQYRQKVEQIARSIQMPGDTPQPRFANLSPERLAQVLSSDYVPSELKQMAVEQFRPQDPEKMQVTKLADGRYYYIDPTGRQDPRLVAPNVTPTPPDPADEYGRYAAEERAAGRTPLSRIDYANAKKGNGFNVTTPDGMVVSYGGGQQFGTPPGQNPDATGTPRDSGKLSSELSKKDAAALEEINTAGRTATDLESLATQLETITPQVGYTGPGGDAYGFVDDMVGFLPGDSGARGAFKSLAMEAQLTFTEKTKGAITDREMGMFRAAVPNLSQTKEGNMAIAQVMKAGAARAQSRAAFFENWARKHGSLEGAQEVWSEYMRDNPLIAEAGKGVKANPEGDWQSYLNRQPAMAYTPESIMQMSQEQLMQVPIEKMTGPQLDALERRFQEMGL